MNKLVSKKVIPYALVATLMLSGCGKKSECEIPSRHVHKYTKQVTDDISIEKYLDDEHLDVWGYKWNEDYIEITKNDEAFYKALNGLFYGATNWDYLYYEMATHHDYLEFYYEYYTYETRTRTNSDGDTETYTERVHHDGWHSNPNDSDNTGRTRLCHHRYYGYRIIYQDGKYKKEQSPYVDDIRDIIDEYPYFGENDIKVVDKEFRFKKSELKYLFPEDFDVFTNPDLTNKNLQTGKVKIKN